MNLFFLIRSNTLDEIAEEIVSSFDMNSITKNISEQFTLPSASQLLRINNQGEGGEREREIPLIFLKSVLMINILVKIYFTS